jgi:hypothetical protein
MEDMIQRGTEEPFRVETTRNSRHTFAFGKAAATDIGRAISSQMQVSPHQFPENTPFLLDRLKSGNPLTKGDVSVLVQLHPQLPGLSMAADAALRTAAQKLSEISSRDQQRFLYFRSTKPDAGQ